ncbi:Serine acetyltransferase [Sporotomaculum syntrophicum]|uniref:Serine acetyltransferase n=1 Tax=Sporotomaculum syntrophicum TaxID=182264 RepID=A0A9D3AYR5_9FIRM|nr:serine O-acetyltransferase EpsC [Sporotomaculum syntrophicum]KAF1085736.1 Serine acetyltransferase [Sporotomaculum syntrophicum]
MSKLDPQKINNLVESIVAGYRVEPQEALKSFAQPKRDAIIRIILMLRELLFPEYYGQRHLVTTAIQYHIGDLLMHLHEQLHEQIILALEHRPNLNAVGSIADQADEIIYKFLSTIPELRSTIELDVQAAFDGDPAAVDKHEIILAYPGIFAISVYRMAHELHLLSVPLIPRIMTEYAHNVTGIDIHPGATIGKYFFIDHGTGVVIGETTTIGDNVKIYQGVTLGALSPREGQNLRGVKRHPTIEDNVTVYSGTSILGGNTVIGKGATIGSNVFLTKSVPAGTKVSIKIPELMFKGLSPDESSPEYMELDI